MFALVAQPEAQELLVVERRQVLVSFGKPLAPEEPEAWERS